LVGLILNIYSEKLLGQSPGFSNISVITKSLIFLLHFCDINVRYYVETWLCETTMDTCANHDNSVANVH
jgi:hypothetical protein